MNESAKEQKCPLRIRRIFLEARTIDCSSFLLTKQALLSGQKEEKFVAKSGVPVTLVTHGREVKI